MWLLVWLQLDLLEQRGFNIPVDADLRRICGRALQIDSSDVLFLYDAHIFIGFLRLKIVKINTCRIQTPIIIFCMPCMLDQIILQQWKLFLYYYWACWNFV